MAEFKISVGKISAGGRCTVYAIEKIVGMYIFLQTFTFFKPYTYTYNRRFQFIYLFIWLNQWYIQKKYSKTFESVEGFVLNDRSILEQYF